MTLGPVNYLYKGCVDSMNPPPLEARTEAIHITLALFLSDSVLALLH